MHSRETRAAAIELHAIGMSPNWITRELAISRRTLQRWLDSRAWRTEPPRTLPPGAYSYLLGLYLGDGHISRGRHGQRYLAISCDAAYPGIVEGARAAIAEIVPTNAIWLSQPARERCVRVISCSRWWPVLFPQHGSGAKHTRHLAFAFWQRAITTVHARELVRGLLHSDGSRFVANQRVAGRTYSYPRYAFTNRSPDIVAILCEHLDLLGIGWTRPRADYVAVDRRSEVVKLDAFVGAKR